MQSITLRQNGVRRWISMVLVCCLLFPSFSPGIVRATDRVSKPEVAIHSEPDDSTIITVSSSAISLPWPSYLLENTKYDFSLFYPKTWSYEENNWQTEDKQAFNYLLRFHTTNGEMLSVLVWDKIGNLSAMEWTDAGLKPILPSQTAFPESPNAIIAGQQAVVIPYISETGDPPYVFIHFTYGERGYRIQYTALQYGADFQQVIDVIKTLWFTAEFTQGSGLPESQLPMIVTESFVDVVNSMDISLLSEQTQEDTSHCGENNEYYDPTYNRYACGQCTWWAAYSRPDIPMVDDEWPAGAHAKTWANRARQHPYSSFSVVSYAESGAIAVFGENDDNDEHGHVAYVTNVHSDGTFDITEMNAGGCEGTRRMCRRERLSPVGVSFILAGVTLFDQPNFGGRSIVVRDWMRFKNDVSDLSSSYFPNGNRIDQSVSSIYIPPNWHIIAFDQPNHQGAWRERFGTDSLSSSFWDLSLDNYSDSSNMNNNVASIQIGYMQCLILPNQISTFAQNSIASECQPPPPPVSPSVDSATFIRDVTLPDHTVVSPGANLVKTWRVRNSGTSIWNGYRLIFRSGNQMGAPASVNIPYTPPGHEVDISVPIVAPQASARGDWHIVNTSGTLVRNGGMWVILTVQGTEPVVTSDIDLECVNNTCYATVTPGQTFRPTIRATVNSGQLLESRGDMLRLKDGDLFGAWPHVAVQGTVNTGQSYDFTFYADNPIQAPTQEGTYQNTWQIWRNGNWAGEEFTLRFTVSQSGSSNRAPNRPTLTGPSDWAVYQGNTGITLSAQHNGDPDGDAVTHYYFDIFESAQLASSGWIASNSWSPQGLGYFGYQWRVKVRDSHGAESGWSDVRHFTVYNPQIIITQLDFVPLGNGEQVRIMACASGTANTLKVQVNTANDGSDSGEWRTLKELGVPCFNENDAPIWTILNYASGPHRVRALARGDGGWENAAVLEKTYTVAANLRPNSPSGILPSDRAYLNSRTVNLQWTETFRTTGYQLQASESATFDTLLLDQTFPAGLTQHTQIFSADYATVYWRVTAVGPYGTHESNRRFHIDLDAPTSSMTALSPVTTDTKFNVNWTSTDARSGVRWYHVQMRDVSRPDSAWEDWLVNTTKQAELFQGQPGHTYAFRVRAMDNIGNWEAWPDDDYGHTHTLVDPASAPQTAWWDANYAHKRNLVILNNDSNTMPADFPIHIRFDATTTPAAAEIYNASLAATKGDDVRVVYDNETELHRFVQRFTPDQIDLWFSLQAALGGGQTNSGDYQLYYGHAGGSSPPANINAVFLPKTDSNTVLLAHFQEASGSTVADTSGRSHHGSFSNAGWADGFLGYAGSFNGTNSEVIFSNHVDFNLTAMTLEAWVWIPTDAPGDRHIFNKDTYWVRLTGSYWPYSKIFGIESGDGCPSVQPNTWAHIAVAYNGTNRVRTYVNGQRCNEKVISGFSPSHTAAAFRVGNAYNWPGRHFLGRIQHVRVSNIERTSFPYASITTPPSVEAGIPIAPSVPGAPDLAILDLTTYPNPDGGLLVVAQVENQGDADTQSNFYTDLYVNHLPTGAGDYTGSLQFWVNMPIEASAQITLTTVITDLAGMGGYMMHALSAPGAEVTATLYAQVDSVGVISETDTTNNISPGIEICLASPDAYAGDDDTSGVSWLNLGEVQQRNFDRPTDRDWVKFTAHGGVTYTLHTFDLGNAADTYLYLYDTDGATLLSANDDYGGSLASRIDWMAPVTGTYYALVQHWNPNVGGCGTGYKLSLTEQLTIHTLYLPLIVRN